MTDFQAAFEHLDVFIERELPASNAPGLAIGLTNRERLLRVGVYGWANCDARQPVVPATLFQIGSISKAFTSIVLLQLQEQDLLHIDDPVTKYLPWFEISSEYPPITLRHLMSHTAGIVMGSDDTLSAYTEARNLRYTQTTAPPGEMFHYSNSGYKILGLVLQTILGQNMTDILRQRILNPLRMRCTEPVITNTMRSRLAIGYAQFHDDRPLPRAGRLAPATWFESDTADGAISSNAEDMCCYLRALLNRGKNLLTSQSFEQLIQPHIPTGDDLHGEHYGLGLSTRQMEGHQVIGHSGGMVGYSADLLADLDAGLGVVVLTNGPADPEKISQHALKLLRAAWQSDDLAAVSVADPLRVDHAEDYAGSYRCGEKVFALTPENEHLTLEFAGDSVSLEPRQPDVFLVPHPAFEMFLLRFERNSPGEDKTKITEALYGPDVYLREGASSPPNPSLPPEWQAYPGHYRSHNPWLSNFRIVICKGSLVLIYPWGNDEPLYPQPSGSFRVGADSRSPEFIRFDWIIDGKAMQANFSGGVYCRMFTP